jgi:hypothetical protein
VGSAHDLEPVVSCRRTPAENFAAVAIQAIEIGVAYKAKTLCSGVLVAGRDPAAVLAELQADDLAVLPYIRASIDSVHHSVTASLPWFVARRAVHRRGLGCALVLNGLIPPTLPDRHETIATPDDVSPRDAAASIEGAGAGEIEAAVARAFSEPDSKRLRRTLAVVVMWRGRIVAERYATGIGPDTPLAGWSMTKSVSTKGLLPEGWVTYTTSPAPADRTKRYGAHFWLQVPEEYAGAAPRLHRLLFTRSGTRDSSLRSCPRVRWSSFALGTY